MNVKVPMPAVPPVIAAETNGALTADDFRRWTPPPPSPLTLASGAWKGRTVYVRKLRADEWNAIARLGKAKGAEFRTMAVCLCDSDGKSLFAAPQIEAGGVDALLAGLDPDLIGEIWDHVDKVNGFDVKARAKNSETTPTHSSNTS